MPGIGKTIVLNKAKRRRSKTIRSEISKASIRRLARRGGVKRISALIYPETKALLRAYLKNIISDAIKYTEHGKRKTVTTTDVVYALKRQGRILYGFC